MNKASDIANFNLKQKNVFENQDENTKGQDCT